MEAITAPIMCPTVDASATHVPVRVRQRVALSKAVAFALFVTVIAGCHRAEPNGTQSTVTVQIQESQSAEQKAEVLEQSVADGSKVAPAVTELIKKPEAQNVDPTGREPLDDAITCLARTVYWEARGDGTESMESVANVVMNRLRHDGFPKTVCDVVKQGQEQGECQFSWWCDGRSDSAFEDEPYATAKEVARKALNQQLPDRTDGALYFHHHGVAPNWSRMFVKTAEVGDFAFYKP